MYSSILNGEKKAPYVVSLVADTETDVATLPTHYSPGSKCFVISTSKTYMLNNQKQWVSIIVSGGGEGTVVDGELADQEDVDNLFNGDVALASTEDIDNLFS